MQEVGGSIPPGSTIKVNKELIVYRLGLWSLYIGLMLTVFGLILGAIWMFWGSQDGVKAAIMVIPMGFLLLFNGMVTTILFSPKKPDGAKTPK